MLDVRYKLDAPIAAGGVGQVWRGTDLLLRRPVAVKLLRPEYASHPETLERFRAEARHAGKLNHPCVARVYDYCDGGTDTSPYLVMELVDGPSLAEVLDAGTIDPPRAMGIVAQAAAGLAAAHQTGLVHRDVKPGNILLSPDGMVKITDFGLAHAAGSARVTAPDVVMGTPQYLAPERLTATAGSPASDLYSLGIVLYECLAGRPPFSGTAAEVTAAHLHHPLPPLPSDVPPAIGELLDRLTAKDPAARLADANELATTAGRLSTALAANEDLATPTRTDIPPTGHRRRRQLAMTTAAAVLAVFSCWLAFGPFGVLATHERAAPGPTGHLLTPPAKAAPPGTRQPADGATGGSGKPGQRNAAPSRSQSTDGPGADRHTASSGQNARPARETGSGASKKPDKAGTSSSGSGDSGSGMQLQLPLPGPSISLGL
jgi:eukaryotic-like serine/threonine-protein kinase